MSRPPFSLRHKFLNLLIPILLLASQPAAAQTLPPPPGASEWQAFTRRYMAADGRIIDTANRGISHSEGQGYSMFFAVQFDDRERFDLIWRWTQRNLSRPRDALFAWRYDPNASLAVSDPNNATDGEIFIAWSLVRAAERWGVPEYRESARRIAADVLRCCVTEVGGRTIMLPGAQGFRDGEGVVVNLSYYAFPALRALSHVAPDRRWAALEADSLSLMQEAGFGRWRLPPDWLLLPARGGPPAPATRWPARFSWDAVRVPLNLAWQRHDTAMVAAARMFWMDPGFPNRPPAWIDLRSGETPPYAGHAGLRAVRDLLRSLSGEAGVVPLRVADAPDYFGSALLLQARLALYMPVEPPALVPETPPEPPSRTKRAMDAAQAAWTWLRPPASAETPEPATPQWSRAEFTEPAQVRGMPVGLRGLVPPR